MTSKSTILTASAALLAMGALFAAAGLALIEGALRNLLESALRVSPPGAAVRLTVTVAPRRMAVVDLGSGLDAAKLAGLMEPFQRGPRGGATFSLTFPR